MSGELIERLRTAVEQQVRGRTNATITCQVTLNNPPGAHSCNEQDAGHACYWNDPPIDGRRHARYMHKCRCGHYWGEGVKL